MNFSFPKFGISLGITARKVALLVVMAAGLATTGQAAECDCSCDGYAELRQVTQDARAAAGSDGRATMPADAIRATQCLSICGPQWSQCSKVGGDTTRPDTAAGRGNDAATNAADKRDPHATTGPGKAPRELSRDRLTTDYLAGTWCSVYGGQEVTQWQFQPNGDHRIGFPAGGGMAMRPELQRIEAFHQRYEALLELEPDSFTTRYKHGRYNVFTRGPCGD